MQKPCGGREMANDETKMAAEWLNRPENDIGFDLHKRDCGASGGLIDPTCERCAVEIALAAYAQYRHDTATTELRLWAERTRAARTTWLESYGVPISDEFAQFAEAIGTLIDLAEK
jgi:hypothetical protein